MSKTHLILGDCAVVLESLPSDSFDALVTDPPAGIAFMGKEWDHDKGGRDQWIAWLEKIMTACFRVMKPGGHGLVWALPRTSHWTATALENAGFEVRDIVVHIFGTGFPKSLDVSKALDKMAGAKREIIAPPRYTRGKARQSYSETRKVSYDYPSQPVTAPATDLSKQWEGYGTALKPAAEHWILIRKPLEGTVAQNVSKHGCGGLNIDGCRIVTSEITGRKVYESKGWKNTSGMTGSVTEDWKKGRWPANLILDEEAGRLLDEQSGVTKGTGGASSGVTALGQGSGWNQHNNRITEIVRHNDLGGVSRFFYCSKASRKERGEGNDHPTVKPLALMRYLCRLVTPKGGHVLDPFMGSGTTGLACQHEGFDFTGIELSVEYLQIAKQRMLFKK